MSFVVIGLNHATAPLDVLEQVTIAPEAMDKALHDVSLRPHISEVVVLSTCNRTEVYVAAERFHGAFQDVRDFFAEISSVLPERLNDVLYTFHDDHAIEHLFRVAAGVDSAVLGEHEIQGQVKRAWLASQEHGCVGTQLNAVFRSALEAGKRVRTETAISERVASVSQAAVVLAAEKTGFADRNVLLIGAGEMGSGMALSIADHNPASITVMSRSDATAAEIAGRIDAQVRPIAELDAALAECDLAFTSTASPSLLIDAPRMARIMQARAHRQLLIVDVAMPRDVDAEAADIEGLDLCDLDSISAFVAQGLAARSDELADATAIIDDEVGRHVARTHEVAMTPLIAEFRSTVEEIRAAEVARQSKRLGELSPEQQDAVDEITRAVVAKVMHEPTVRLKESASSLRGERLASALRELFDLDS